MDENERLHEIFEHISVMLWEQMEQPAKDLPKTHDRTIDNRIAAVGRTGERLQRVISAYAKQQAEMMQNLMREDDFSGFPLPKQRIGMWKRILIRRELWKAIHPWPFRGRRGS